MKSVLSILSLGYRVNVLGVIASVLTLLISLSEEPWWVLTGGEAFFAHISPFSISINILGRPLLIPIIPYLTLSARLSTMYAAITMLLGSLSISKDWSRLLMNRRLLWLAVGFVISLYITSYIAGNYAGISYRVVGEDKLSYPIPLGETTILVEASVKTYLTLNYWIALATGLIAFVAKALHNRLVKSIKTSS